MGDKSRNFRDLEVGQLGKKIVVAVYQGTRNFPTDERFGLTSQMRRAAVSVPSNIAGGFNRFGNKEYRQFLHVALGSCAELETQIELSCELGFLKQEAAAELLEKLDYESRMLRNLAKRLNA